ncbi:unnamed protein product [Rhizophagus irregularis]|nr:unnamed protein product [Rhizophagus irregularis]
MNRFKVPMQTKSKDKFVDAQSEPLLTIPKMKEEHEELDNLNETFSKRLDKENKISSLLEEMKKNIEDKDKINEIESAW